MMNKRSIGNASVINFGRKINKRGALGESVTTLYRIVIIIIVSFVILGASSMVYSHHINVRDSEAMIMIREISDCVLSDAIVDLAELEGVDNIFEYCGYDANEVERFFISVSIFVEGSEVLGIEGGDSGSLWVKDLYDPSSGMEAIGRYEPGHFKMKYGVVVLDESVGKDGELIVEVVVNVE